MYSFGFDDPLKWASVFLLDKYWFNNISTYPYWWYDQLYMRYKFFYSVLNQHATRMPILERPSHSWRTIYYFCSRLHLVNDSNGRCIRSSGRTDSTDPATAHISSSLVIQVFYPSAPFLMVFLDFLPVFYFNLLYDTRTQRRYFRNQHRRWIFCH